MLVSFSFLQRIEHFHYTVTGILLSNKTLQSICNKRYFSLSCFTQAEQSPELTRLPTALPTERGNRTTRSVALGYEIHCPHHQPFKNTQVTQVTG